jgi:hypothetical protein
MHGATIKIRDFLFAEMSRQFSGPLTFLSNWYCGYVPWVKRPGHKFNHSPFSVA